MEIVAENTVWGPFLFAIIMFGIVAGVGILGLFGGVFMAAEVGIDSDDITGIIVSAILAVVFGLMTAWIAETGPNVKYEAIVNDYNEVYEQGYEIVDQRGEITIIRKVGE